MIELIPNVRQDQEPARVGLALTVPATVDVTGQRLRRTRAEPGTPNKPKEPEGAEELWKQTPGEDKVVAVVGLLPNWLRPKILDSAAGPKGKLVSSYPFNPPIIPE